MDNVPEKTTPSKVKGWLFFCFQIFISAAAIWYAFRSIELDRLWDAFRTFSKPAIVLVFTISVMSYFAAAERLRFLMPGGKFRRYLIANLICIGANTVFPAKAGEAIKAVYLSKGMGSPLSRCVGMVFWERLADVSFLIVLAAAILPVDGGTSIVLGCLVLLIIWIVLFLAKSQPVLFHRIYSLFPVSIGGKIRSVHDHSINTISFPWLARLFLLTALYTLSGFTVILMSLTGVAGLSLTLHQVIIVFVVMTFGIALPSTPGGLGVFEASLVLSLSWFDVTQEEALGVALFLRGLQLIPVGFGVGWLILSKFRKDPKNRLTASL